MQKQNVPVKLSWGSILICVTLGVFFRYSDVVYSKIFPVWRVVRGTRSSENGRVRSTSTLPSCSSNYLNDSVDQERGEAGILGPFSPLERMEKFSPALTSPLTLCDPSLAEGLRFDILGAASPRCIAV